MDSMAQSPSDFRCGYVTIVGAPNVGKSTLMNTLIGQKIAIVTNKPQTTRHKILGILSTERSQIIFLDTPGIIRPRYLLQEVMMRSASAAIADADILLFMVDTGPEPDAARSEELSRLQGLKKPVYLLINKIDLVEKRSLLPLIDAYAKQYSFAEIFPVSALRREGTNEVLRALVASLPVHPPMYPLDIVSEHDQRFFVAEIIREKVFLKCEEEIPYSTTVAIEEFTERGSDDHPRGAEKWFIRAEIYVERESQKGIVIGKGGSMLKEIGRDARKDIERFLDHPVYLDLHVRVQERWRADAGWLERMGYRG